LARKNPLRVCSHDGFEAGGGGVHRLTKGECAGRGEGFGTQKSPARPAIRMGSECLIDLGGWLYKHCCASTPTSEHGTWPLSHKVIARPSPGQEEIVFA
jgi:hypothetical protein